jgi:hypothetical protein
MKIQPPVRPHCSAQPQVLLQPHHPEQTAYEVTAGFLDGGDVRSGAFDLFGHCHGERLPIGTVVLRPDGGRNTRSCRCAHNRGITHPDRTMPNTRRPIATPGWLRPLIRGSTRFSLNAPPWVPVVVRNAPLKLSSLVLRQYYRLVR